MPFQIPLSVVKALPFDFDQAVKDHVAARTAHATTIGEPAPTAHELVAAAVRRLPPDETSNNERFVADYEVVDDTPPPPPPPPPQTLEERKHAMALHLHNLAMESYARNVPPLKARFITSDTARIVKIPEDQRSAEDAEKLVEYRMLMRRGEEINLHHGKQEAALHDLTADTIEGWKPEPFPY